MSNLGFNPVTGKFDLEGKSVNELVQIGTIFHAFTGIALADNEWVRFGRVKILTNDKEFVAKIQFMRHNTYPYAELKDLRAGNILIRISCPWHNDRATDIDCILQNAINITAPEIKIVEVEKTATYSYCDIYVKLIDIHDRYYFNYTWNTGDSNILFEVVNNEATITNLPDGTQFSCDWKGLTQNMGTATVINWNLLSDTFTNSITGIWTATDINRPIEGTKCISILPNCTSFSPPIDWVKKRGGDEFGSTSLIIAICVNGIVYYNYRNDEV